MPTPDLVKHWQNSTGQDKEMAFAELQKRLGELMPEKAEKSPEKGTEKSGGGGDEKKAGGGSGGSLEELLKKLLEKIQSGQPLTPEEQQLADKLGLKAEGKNNPAPDQSSNPDQISVNVAPPGPV
ncbi:hypothetical protein [Noviherbaspirillum aerium]|uniref:hypothetical protein n=1 Tax=Noviherbaspirillum aerium TaxID=2588497 RepID=UPI00124F05A5|nr:hypothetical protein [Noviherbaspirillum aerium]